MTGREFCNFVRLLPRIPDREEQIYQAVAAGDIVAWPWCDVAMDGRTIRVAGDYLAIGTIDDFVRMPVSGPLALRICALLGYRPPTQEEVVAIYQQADVKIHAEPFGPPYDDSMLSIDRVEWAHLKTETQRKGRGGLVAGHRKDVIGVRARRDSDHPGAFDPVLAFFGWFDPHGAPIQRDNGAHEPGYADYSHGLRLVYES